MTTPTAPITLPPLPGNRYSLEWPGDPCCLERSACGHFEGYTPDDTIKLRCADCRPGGVEGDPIHIGDIEHGGDALAELLHMIATHEVEAKVWHDEAAAAVARINGEAAPAADAIQCELCGTVKPNAYAFRDHMLNVHHDQFEEWRDRQQAPAVEAQFGVPGCTCRPWTRQNGDARYLDQPGDTVDMISGWEIGRDCPHHKSADEAPADRAALRERIAEAIADALKPRYGGPQHNTTGGLPLTATPKEARLYRAQPLADAVLAVLPTMKES